MNIKGYDFAAQLAAMLLNKTITFEREEAFTSKKTPTQLRVQFHNCCVLPKVGLVAKSLYRIQFFMA